MALAIIGAKNKPGKVKITATSDGLPSASVLSIKLSPIPGQLTKFKNIPLVTATRTSTVRLAK